MTDQREREIEREVKWKTRVKDEVTEQREREIEIERDIYRERG